MTLASVVAGTAVADLLQRLAGCLFPAFRAFRRWAIASHVHDLPTGITGAGEDNFVVTGASSLSWLSLPSCFFSRRRSACCHGHHRSLSPPTAHGRHHPFQCPSKGSTSHRLLFRPLLGKHHTPTVVDRVKDDVLFAEHTGHEFDGHCFL